MNCPVCGKKLKRFDALIMECQGDNHRSSVLFKDNEISFLLIRIYITPTSWYAFEFDYEKNYTNLGKGESTGVNSESSRSIYFQKGILEFDFSRKGDLLERMEKLETFS